MPRETRHRVVVLLPPGAYRELESQAAREDRVAAQQASYLLRRLLEGARETSPDERDPAPAR